MELRDGIYYQLQRPPLPSPYVARERLTQASGRPGDAALTLVCAPAGFGKTTFLTAWLQESSLPTAWLTLDERHDSLVEFVRYLAAAVEHLFPHACSHTLARLHSPHTCQPVTTAASFVSEIDLLPHPFILVLDDYHTLREPAVHRFLLNLVTNLPRGLRLVIASREDPPLPLARLRVSGQMTEIRVRHLRFNRTEAHALFTQAVDVELSAKTVALLAQKTEGWIAGLRLAVLSLREAADPAAYARTFAGTARHVASYLLDEVLVRQPLPVQEFLLRTALLDRPCPALCDALLAEESPVGRSEEILARLEQGGLFVEELDEQPVRYRYHPLFRDLLQRELAVRLPTHEIATLHRRAANWFAEQGQVDEALRHARAAGDEGMAVRLVETHLVQVVDHEQWHVLKRWLSLLPETAQEERPALLLARVWLLHSQFRLADTALLAHRAEARLADEALCLPECERQVLLGVIDTVRGKSCYFEGQYARCREHTLRALERLPIKEGFVRGTALLFLAVAQYALGECDQAWQAVDEALASEGTAPPTYLSRALLAQALLCERSGQLEKLADVSRRQLRCASESRLALSTAWAHAWLGYVHYEWNALSDAMSHFATTISLRHSGQVLSVFDSYTGQVLTLQAQGQPDAANATLAEMLSFVEEIGNPAFFAPTYSLRARLALEQGDFESAERWLANASSVFPEGPLIWFEMPQLTRVRVLLAQQGEESLDAALASLQEGWERARSSHDTRRMIEVLALQAVALDARGRLAEALGTVTQAVTLARPGGFIRSFVDAGPRMAVLLHRMAERGHMRVYVDRLLASFPRPAESGGGDVATEPAPSPDERPLRPLTPREREILHLLARRLSDQEIADQLVVSRFTVKRHTSSVYYKLRVPGRRQAVEKARALGLLA